MSRGVSSACVLLWACQAAAPARPTAGGPEAPCGYADLDEACEALRAWELVEHTRIAGQPPSARSEGCAAATPDPRFAWVASAVAMRPPDGGEPAPIEELVVTPPIVVGDRAEWQFALPPPTYDDAETAPPWFHADGPARAIAIPVAPDAEVDLHALLLARAGERWVPILREARALRSSAGAEHVAVRVGLRAHDQLWVERVVSRRSGFTYRDEMEDTTLELRVFRWTPRGPVAAGRRVIGGSVWVADEAAFEACAAGGGVAQICRDETIAECQWSAFPLAPTPDGVAFASPARRCGDGPAAEGRVVLPPARAAPSCAPLDAP